MYSSRRDGLQTNKINKYQCIRGHLHCGVDIGAERNQQAHVPAAVSDNDGGVSECRRARESRKWTRLRVGDLFAAAELEHLHNIACRQMG